MPGSDELINVYFGDILVKSEDDNGNLIVSGKAAGPDLDLDHQILDPDWLASAMPQWFQTGGNIRLQHNMHKPVGKATSHTEKTDGHWITAKIVDPEAKKLVTEEVLTGFSVGIKNPSIDMSAKAVAKAPGGIVKGGSVVETSIVDRACNSSCVLTLAKAAGPGVAVVLPPGVTPETDKGLVRTEEIVKVSTSAGHSHPHTHEDGAHEHAHAHSPIEGHYDHGDDAEPVPHAHPHDPKDPPRVEESGEATESNEGGEGLSEPERDKAARAAAEALLAPTFDAGPQAPTELHKATVARLEANQSPPANASTAETSLTIEAIQAMIDKGVEAALAKAKKDPSDPHPFVDDDKDGKCDTCGEKREDGMHHKDFGKAAEPTVVKKDYSAAKRVELAKKGQAIPVRDDKGEIVGGRYPIADGGDLEDAVQSFGRGKPSDADEIKAYIKKRAKALGMTDKIPDDWKAADLDIAKSLLGPEFLTKQEDGDVGKPDHTDAYGQACAGLAQLVQEEAQELAAGDDEYWSLSCLLDAIRGLRAWRMGETKEGEMDPMDLNQPSYMFAVVADLTKAVQSLPGTVATEVAKALRWTKEDNEPIVMKAQSSIDQDEFAATLRKELATAMKPLEGIEALSGRMAKVEETVERIAKSPVPTGPRRTGMSTNGPAQKSAAEAYRERAEYLQGQAARSSNPVMAQGYRDLARDELAKAAALEAPKTT